MPKRSLLYSSGQEKQPEVSLVRCLPLTHVVLLQLQWVYPVLLQMNHWGSIKETHVVGSKIWWQPLLPSPPPLSHDLPPALTPLPYFAPPSPALKCLLATSMELTIHSLLLPLHLQLLPQPPASPPLLPAVTMCFMAWAAHESAALPGWWPSQSQIKFITVKEQHNQTKYTNVQ